MVLCKKARLVLRHHADSEHDTKDYIKKHLAAPAKAGSTRCSVCHHIPTRLLSPGTDRVLQRKPRP
jgi:hypothetical protein